MSDAVFAQKLLNLFKPKAVPGDPFKNACKEILAKYKFDCVFLAYAGAPEEAPTVLAADGKTEIIDACLYRLGIEERIALSKVTMKTYSDITGKPVFNKAGSLRIQKPNGGIFFVFHRPKQDFLLLGCAHQDPKAYDQELQNDLRDLWEPLKIVLCDAARKPKSVEKGMEPQAPPALDKESPGLDLKFSESASTLSPAAIPPAAKAVPTSKPMMKGDDRKRPVILVDEVTRLFNKDYFEECLGIEVERAKRYSRNVSLLFLSVAPIEGSGVLADDRAIANQVAEILNKSLRRVDIICRLENNKYGIILPDTANNTYGVIAKRIFKFFKQIMGDAPPVFLNISASTYPKHAGNHFLLYENTDKLLTQAQGVGPNKAVLPE
ncbi:MAG TPA: diguanylate cyclase [bacterium]|nr:diguanylate cyclase [bacterium]